MKRFLKKFGFALLVVSVVLTCLWAAAGAYSVPAEKRALLPSQVLYVPGPMDPNQQIRSVQTQTEPLQIVPMAEEEYLTSVNEAGAVLREKMKNREETVTILCAVDAGMDANALVDAITDAAVAHTGVATEGDYLQWQYGGMSYGISGYTDGVTNYYTLECTIFYYTTADQEAVVDAAVEKLWADLAVDGMTDYEKLCAVYNWMCANITYDYDNLNDDTYDLKYTAYAALVDRTSVCQGYALLLYRLMLEQGIDCRVITGIGNGGPHAWNIVALDGQYYNLDATWDASWHQAGAGYNFFLRSNATFEDHAREEVYSTDEFNAAYPMSEADYAPAASCEHAWFVFEVVAPTCTDGYTVYMCSYCGEQYCDDFVPGAGEHTWDVFDVIAPTCQDGYTVYMCSLCGEMREDDYVTAVFTHDWGEWNVSEEPTCGTVGWQVRFCNYCGIDEGQEIAQTDNHDFVTEVVEPTCQAHGYTLYTCSYCGICYDDNYVPSVDHNYESVVVPPTCTEEGYTIHTCTMCGLWYKTDFVNPQELSPWVIVTAPTTEEEGLALRECPVCNELEQKVLPKKQSAAYILDLAKAFEETLDPIDYFGGYLDPFFMASFTNEILLEGFEYTDYLCVPAAEYEAVLNRYFAVDAAALDEIRNSYVTYSASQQTYTICWLDGVEVGLPGGKMVGYVKNGDVYEVYYGHAHYAHLQDALPDGVDMYEYASGLGWPDTIEYDGVVYESYYDTYIAVVSVENYGNKYTVEFNNHSTIRVLSSAEGYVAEDLPEHLHLHLPETVAPTCTQFGYTNYVCTCGETNEGIYVDPLGHECSLWTMTKAPTTEEEGLAEGACTVCGDTAQRVLGKLPTEPVVDYVTAFKDALNDLDHYWGWELRTILILTHQRLLADFDFSESLCLPASEYEAAVDRYFALDDDLLNQIREYPWTDLVDYDETTQTYTISLFTGWGENTPNRELAGYVNNGNIYDVYYASAVYSYLYDDCPDTDPLWEYLDEVGWTKTVEYNGLVYEYYNMVGYAAVISLGDSGTKYTVEVNGSTVRILSVEGYTAEDLPDHIHFHVSSVVAPTCTNQGYTAYTCTCGETNEGDYVDSLGHSFTDGVCTRCGEVASEGNYCGDNLTWVLSDEGILTISGTGTMWDFYSMSDCPWYSYTNQIVHIVINEGVTSIGSHAFENFTNLQGIVIADSVKSIGMYAFSGCTSLSSVVMPAVMTDIGFAAFSGCTSLESIALPQGLTELSGKLFYGCTNLSNITIPQGVTTIGDAAFQDCASLTNIVLPEGVTTIGNYAFNCSGLTDITLFQGVTTIGDAAFSKCQGLTGIVLPDSVTTIGNEAFSGCTGFSSIELPKNLTTLGEYAFWGCTSLESVVTPDTMSTIGFAAFSGCTSLRSIVIPQGVTVINGDLFSGCTSLESVTIPQGVTSIGSSAFRECTSLTSIVLPEGVTTIGDSAFLRCSNLADIVMAQSITSIGRYAFAECTSLKSIVIPEGVTEIGERTFEQCSSLEAIVLPDSVTTVGQWAFCDCVNLRTAVIGNGVTTIADYAFYHCEGLTDVTIGNSLENIGVSAFAYCYSLTKITLPATATNIGDQAFSHCTSMTSINIPDGVVRIGRETFMNCDSLLEIVIPDSVTTLGEWSFYSCDGLTSITIGSGVTKIEWVSFLNCTSLQAVYISDIAAWCAIDFADFQCNPLHCAKNLYLNGQLVTDLVIPESVTAISKYAFYGCESLTSVTIPSGVTCVAERTFALCKNLTSITLPDSVTSLGDQAFYACSSLSEINIPGSVTSIGRTTFGNCTSLTEIVIPASVTSLGDYAFDSCTGLTSVVIPETVTSLGVGLFNWCHGLTQVTLPSHLTSIGGYMFNECTSLADITIPDGVQIIGECAFGNCASLTGITIPASVTSIEFGAFQYCENLTDIRFLGDAPAFSGETFRYATAICYYPVDNETWTEDVKQNYGGTVTWLPICTGEHTYETVITAPTCVDQGYTAHTCSVCGYSYKDTYTEALGHDMGEWIVDQMSTCIQAGSEHRNCSRCDYTETQETPLGEHVYNAVVSAPSCEYQGYTTYTCAVCGNSYMDSYTDPLGHDMGQWEQSIAPDCTRNGEERRFCSRCDHTEYRSLEPTGHKYESEVIEPTCSTDGYTLYTCSECGHHYADNYTDRLPHNYDGIVSVSPTCESDGEMYYICYDCGDSYTEVIPATGHTSTHIENQKDATCGTDGYTGDTVCDACGKIMEYGQPIYASGQHNYTSQVTVEPGCVTNGVMTYTCTACGDSYTVEIIATGHGIPYIQNEKAATCLEDGYSGDEVCSDCGEIVKYGSVIPAVGHQYTTANAAEPTCGADGYTGDTVCANCGYVSATGQTIPATGQHSYIVTVIAEPTCDFAGLRSYYCPGCYDEYTEEIPAKGHTFATEIVEPTCYSEGYTTYTCTECSYYYIGDYTERTPHSFETSTTPPTCTEDGFKSYHCTVCGDGYGETIPATGHQNTTVIDRSEPTCGWDGYSGDTRCDDCGMIIAYGSVIPRTGNHSFTQWKTIVEPTEYSEGMESRECTACGLSETRAIPMVDHVHDYHHAVTVVAPTCTQAGYTIYECRCGDSYTADEVAALGHTAQTSYGFPATCTADGLTDGEYCSACGEVLVAQTVIPALGHTEVIDAAVAPTCTATGLTEGKHCSTCGTVLAAQTEVAALGHEMGEWTTTKQPTCTENGAEQRKCNRCDHTETRDMAAKGHTEVIDAAVAPTCTATGLTEGKHCSVCGEVTIPQQVIAASGHTEVIDAAVAPTCTESGLTEGKHCAVCGEVTLAQTVVDALGHSYGQWYTVKAPGEFEDGLEQRDCANCGAAETRTIPAIGHTHNYVGVGTAPTCTEPGYTTYTCYCGDSYIADEVPATGHAEVVVPGAAPTCTETGLTDGKYCTVCGETTLAQTVIPALGHTEVIDAAVAPTCTEAGLTEGKHCTVCGEVTVAQAVVSALGHSEVIIEGVAPTCTESGLTEGKYCDRCGEVDTPQQEIPAIGHNYVSTVIAPTCTEMGYTTHSCTNCGASYTSDQVDALGHKHEAVVTAPTCTEGGYTTYTCHCGDSYVAEKTEPAGHSWDAGVVTIAPTTQTEGEKICTCTACGETRREVLPVLPDVVYDIPEDETVTIPDNYCFEDGTTVKVEEVTEVETVETVTEAMEPVAEKYVAYEFTATKEDAPVQPSGKLTVTFAIPAGYSNNVTVYYMAQNGKLTELDAVVDPEARTVTVELEHFSTYIVVDQDSAPAVLMGDVNGDGRVNVRDARTILRYIAGLIDASELNLDAADFNGDTRINVRDARAILRDIAGLG